MGYGNLSNVFAQSIAHAPKLLVAYEPLSGLAPIARRGIVELLRELAREGMSMLVSSHVLHEVEELTGNVLRSDPVLSRDRGGAEAAP